MNQPFLSYSKQHKDLIFPSPNECFFSFCSSLPGCLDLDVLLFPPSHLLITCRFSQFLFVAWFCGFFLYSCKILFSFTFKKTRMCGFPILEIFVFSIKIISQGFINIRVFYQIKNPAFGWNIPGTFPSFCLMSLVQQLWWPAPCWVQLCRPDASSFSPSDWTSDETADISCHVRRRPCRVLVFDSYVVDLRASVTGAVVLVS